MNNDHDIVNWYWEGLANVALSRANPHFAECRIGAIQGGTRCELQAAGVWIEARQSQVEWILDAMVKEHTAARMRAKILECEGLQELLDAEILRNEELEVELRKATVEIPQSQREALVLAGSKNALEALAGVRARYQECLDEYPPGCPDHAARRQYIGCMNACQALELELKMVDVEYLVGTVLNAMAKK